MDTLISNVTVVTMNEKMEVLFGANIGIDGGKISYIGTEAPREKPATIHDGTGMVAIPGLVNCHTHLATTALRGYFDNAPRAEALQQLLQKEARMDSRCAKAAAKLAIAECVRFGTTSVSDLYYYPEATAQALEETGMKGNLALSAYRYIDENEDFDFETDEQCRELCRLTEKWNGFDGGRIRIDAGIHAEYTSNRQLWEALAAYATEMGLGMQLHLAETAQEAEDCLERTGLSQAELLDCHRLFSVPTTATDCAAISPDDRGLLGKRRVTAVVTPVAAAKAGKPGTPVLESVRAGMNVALGTGGAHECGNLDLFEAMRSVACAERCRAERSEALPASAVLMMATVCGARAQGRAEECGMLKVGMDADIVLVDFSAPHLIPCHNVVDSLVFSAKGGDVAMTMVRGKVLYESGKFPTIDLGEVVQELMNYALPKLLDEQK